MKCATRKAKNGILQCFELKNLQKTLAFDKRSDSFSDTNYTMFRWFLVLLNLCAISTVRVGEMLQAVYMPQATSIDPPFLFRFSNSCNECLCYRLGSNESYNIINCVKDIRSCYLYTNFSTNYTFQANNNGSVYLFQPPPALPTTIRMTSTAPSAVTSVVAPTDTATTSVIYTSNKNSKEKFPYFTMLTIIEQRDS